MKCVPNNIYQCRLNKHVRSLASALFCFHMCFRMHFVWRRSQKKTPSFSFRAPDEWRQNRKVEMRHENCVCVYLGACYGMLLMQCVVFINILLKDSILMLFFASSSSCRFHLSLSVYPCVIWSIWVTEKENCIQWNLTPFSFDRHKPNTLL